MLSQESRGIWPNPSTTLEDGSKDGERSQTTYPALILAIGLVGVEGEINYLILI